MRGRGRGHEIEYAAQRSNVRSFWISAGLVLSTHCADSENGFETKFIQRIVYKDRGKT